MNLCVLGRVHAFLQDYEEAIALLEEAVALNPSFAQGMVRARLHLPRLRPREEAIACIERATELSPRDPHLSSFHAMRALAHLLLGDLEAAADWRAAGPRACRTRSTGPHVLAAALGLLGREEEARRALAGLRGRPARLHAGTGTRRTSSSAATSALVERFLEGLRRAGVPDAAPAQAAA
jgi:tetratricopeptide (TPR) repeat protein